VTRFTLLGPTTLVLLGGAVFAGDPVEERFAAPAPRPVPEIRIADSQEIVIYAPHRPVRVRLGVSYEGRPIGEMWRVRLRQAFVFFDRDRDGVLSEKEVPNCFSDSGMVQMLQNGFYQPTPQDRPTVERLDTNGDGRVSFGEFVVYYKGSTAQVFRGQQQVAENPFSASTTEALFKLMDSDDNGKLTRSEVSAIEKLVATKDSDEDECLSMEELIPNLADPRLRGRVQVQVRQLGAQRVQVSSEDQTVVTYEPGRIPGTLTQRVIKRYDKDDDFELTREECNFDDVTILRLDRDGNGKLDGEELDEWRTGPADLLVSLSISSGAAQCVARIETDAGDLAARGFTVKQVETGRLIVRTGRQPIEFWAFAPVISANQQPPLKQQYQYLFQQAAGGKDHVIEKDLSGPNAVQFQFIRTIFDAADANADGKLARTEFDEFFDLQDSFRNVALAVTPAVQTPTLFQLLDENRDGRLGVRELRTSWNRLLPLEPGEGDVVTKAAIQPSVSIRVTRGADRFNSNQVQFDVRLQNPNQSAPIPQKGPVWFRKMDRNADGDISRIEFLGTRAEFNSIDTDRDELISLLEAETHDAKLRGREETGNSKLRK
jgi:Ca2+-binding EF-hand superfamily protein